jgi:hypothetical protein
MPDHFTTSKGSNSKEMTGNVDGTQLVIAPLERFRKHDDLSREISRLKKISSGFVSIQQPRNLSYRLVPDPKIEILF